MREHNPPHFHAEYGGETATFSIETGQMIQGDLSKNKVPLITAWALIHQEELLMNWGNLQKGLGYKKITPLR